MKTLITRGAALVWFAVSCISATADEFVSARQITINQLDNYAPEAVAYLPTIRVTGMPNPVIRIIDQDSGEVVYAIRAVGDSFRPTVFREGKYTIEIGEPGARRMRSIRNTMATRQAGGTIRMGF